jgi:hypothetical protein
MFCAGLMDQVELRESRIQSAGSLGIEFYGHATVGRDVGEVDFLRVLPGAVFPNLLTDDIAANATYMDTRPKDNPACGRLCLAPYLRPV